jgi:Heliorhodopsin
MATTTKKTTARKKTTAARSTTKSKSAKVTKKASAKKTSSTKSTSKAAVVSTPEKVEVRKGVTITKKTKVFDRFKNLNKWNWAMAALHAAQAVAVVVLSKSDSLFPVSTNYLTLDPIGSTQDAPVLVSATRHLFDVNLAYVVAAFFVMSALAHLYIATTYRKKYEANLQLGINKARWFEYGISASTMMLAIGMLAGITDISTLVLIFGGTLVMNLLGLVMEVHNQTTEKTNWLSYNVGTLAGLVPWVVVGLYLWGANQYGEGDIPTFVYYIYGSIFVFFSSFAVNMVLQYRKKGKWANYLYGEKAYMILSLVAKSALAWQVFAGTLRP